VDTPKPGTYDQTLQQWRQPSTLNTQQLVFQRWLIDHERSEHPPVSQPRGEFVFIVSWPLYK
jgi:hypothetical protein